MERFNGTVAIITGSAAGIGAAVAKKLLQHDLTVVGLDRCAEGRLKDFAEEIKKGSYKGKFVPLKCEITNQEDIKSTLQWVSENVGVPQILINNASINIKKSIEDVTAEILDTHFETNVKASFLFSKETVEVMKSHNVEGHIVNICSFAGHPGCIPDSGDIAYTASMYGLRTISEGFRRELTNHHLRIKVTNISPGKIKIDTAQNVDYTKYNEKTILNPEDVADTILVALNTPPNVLVSEITVMAIHEYC